MEELVSHLKGEHGYAGTSEPGYEQELHTQLHKYPSTHSHPAPAHKWTWKEIAIVVGVVIVLVWMLIHPAPPCPDGGELTRDGWECF